MAAEADLFVENFREGVMDRMGLGYAELSEENPDLLYASLRGLSGNASNRPAHDLNFIANSGCGEWWLESGIPNYSVSLADVVGGPLCPALKIMFHLANPARRGMHLVSYMDESVRSLFLTRAFDTLKAESVPQEERKNFGLHHALDGTAPHSRYYRCRDGQWIALNAIQEKHWETFCEAVDRAGWKTRMGDPTLDTEVEKLFQDAPAAYWEALTANREVCLFRVIPWAEHISFTQGRPQLTVDPLTWAGFAPAPNLTAAPNLGQDTFAVINSMGFINKEIQRLDEARDSVSAGTVRLLRLRLATTVDCLVEGELEQLLFNVAGDLATGLRFLDVGPVDESNFILKFRGIFLEGLKP